jgi:esterase/lipase superfamily enzyme
MAAGARAAAVQRAAAILAPRSVGTKGFGDLPLPHQRIDLLSTVTPLLSRFSRLLPLLAAVCLAGCASLPGAPVAGRDGTPAADIATQPTLSVVTTRKPVNDARAAPWFGSERGSQMSIALVRLASPALAGRFSLASAGLVGWQIESVEKVPMLTVGVGGTRRDVLLYVHGYNQTFASATLDAARLSDSLNFHGDTVLFSWPSRNKLLDYISDRESAIWSRDALETTFESLLANPNIGRVHIVAHSMGSMLTVEGLRQIHARHGDAGVEKIGAVVFAAPDIDVDGFSSSVRRLGDLSQRMTVVTSADDRALAVASRLAGGSRVGSAEKARLEALGIRVIDASGLGWGLINHDLFLSNSQVQKVIAEAIAQTRSARQAVAEPVTRGDLPLP